MAGTTRRTKSKRALITFIGLAVVVVAVVVALIVGNGVFAKDNSTPKGTTIVKVAYAQEDDKVIWNAVNKVLKQRGTNIQVKLVAFTGGSDVAVQAAVAGEVDILSNGHKAFYANEKTKGYKLASLGDTVIVSFNMYSNKYKSPSEIPDGSKIAIPNNTTNAARAYQVLESAGLIKLNPKKRDLPTKQDITSNPKHLVIDEVDPNQIPNLLDDYAAGVTNSYAIVDHGMSPEKDAIYIPSLDLSKSENQQWVNTLEVRADRKNEKNLKAVASAYHTKTVSDVIKSDFKGTKSPAFTY